MGRPLLCELHAHTTWSDGQLTLPELVDLYGSNGFDVLCVTDHAVRADHPAPSAVDPWTWPAYREDLRLEAERARREYDLLLVPGLELTDDRPDPDLSAHALAIGLDRYVSLEAGIDEALRAARAVGAALIAAHPHGPADDGRQRATRRFRREWSELRHLVDRWELFNRDEVYGWLARRGLPHVATGDFHEPGDLPSWKTLVPCAKDERALVDRLRSSAPVYLVPFALDRRGEPQAA